ncbi:hypothetical protein ACNKHX_20855 [Shigella flexneri]
MAKRVLNSASRGVELCFLLMAFLHLLFECRDYAPLHICALTSFSSRQMLSEELTPVLQELDFMGKPHGEKPGCRRIPAFPKEVME